MNSSVTKMWLSCLVASSVICLATAAGNEYLPPSNGYHYDRPPKQFTHPPNNNVPKPTPPSTPYLPVTPPRPSYLPPPTPGQTPRPPIHTHDDHVHHDEHDHHHHHEPGMPFDFAYAVNENGNDYSHNAVSDGDITRGEYRVALPDGRTQIVKYTADWKNGFNAEVTYEGEARYPDQRPNGYGGGPTSGSYVPPSPGGGYQY